MIKMAKGIVEKLKKKLLPYGLISSLFISSLFPLKSFAETVYDKKHDIKMHINDMGVNYGSKGPPTTPLEVRIDLDKTSENERKLGISIFTENWAENKAAERNQEYVNIVNGRANITMAYPKNIEIKKVEQSAYEIYKKSFKDKNMSGGWVELAPIDECPRFNFILKRTKDAKDTAITIAPLLVAGSPLLAIPAYIFAKFTDEMAEDIIEYKSENARMSREESLKKLAENYESSSIIVHPAEKLTTMRDFKIYLQKNENKEVRGDKIWIMLNVGIDKGYSNNKQVGSLENLLINIPLEKTAEESDEKVEWIYDELSEFIEKEVGQCYSIEWHPQSDIDGVKGKELILEAPYHKQDKEYFDATKLLILKSIKGNLIKVKDIDLPYHPVYSLKLFDFDGDGRDDIFIYYCDRDGKNERINVYSYKDGEYKEIENVKDSDARWNDVLKKEKGIIRELEEFK